MTHSNDNCCCCCCKRKREYPSVQQQTQQQQQQTQQQQQQTQQQQQQTPNPCLAGSHWDSTLTMCVPDSGTFGTKPVSTAHQILRYTFPNGVKTLSPLTPGEQKFLDILNTQDDQHITATPDQAAIYRAMGKASSSDLNPTQKAIYDILVSSKPVTDLTPTQQSIAFNAQTRDAIKPSSLNSQRPSASSFQQPSLGNDNRFGNRPLSNTPTSFPTTNTFSTNIPTSNPLTSMFPTTSALTIQPNVPLTLAFPLTTPSGLPTPGPGSSFLSNPIPVPDPVIPPDITTPHVDPAPPGPSIGCGSPLDPQCPTYHPNHSIPGLMSQVDTINTITDFINAKGYRHDPDGVPYIPRGSWTSWDGVTTVNPCTSTTAQISAFVFPPPGGSNCMRGLRDLFYQIKPFADNSNPTVAEIENWNIEVIRLFRRLLGFNQTTHPVYNDKCTFLKAAWSNERDHTNYWSSNYPGSLDGPYGPCTLPKSSNPHCGASFIPTAADQAPYLCPPGAVCQPNSITGGTEGVSSHNEDIPWCCKMSRIISAYLGSDGIGGHTGPFIGRHCFGSSWWLNPSKPGVVVVRDKWTGNLAPTCP